MYRHTHTYIYVCTYIYIYIYTCIAHNNITNTNINTSGKTTSSRPGIRGDHWSNSGKSSERHAEGAGPPRRQKHIWLNFGLLSQSSSEHFPL